MTDSLSSHTTEPGPIARHTVLANRRWIRWLPGLNTLRRYQPSWLRPDLVAGLVMTGFGQTLPGRWSARLLGA